MEDRAYHRNRLFSLNIKKNLPVQWRNAMRSLLKDFYSVFPLVNNTFTVFIYVMYHTPPSLSLSITYIQALDIQCTLWSHIYTPNDILDIFKNYHLLLRYFYLPYTLHWYFLFGHAVIKNTWRFLRSSFKSSAFLFSLSL